LLDRLLTTGALPESEARQVFKRVLEAVRCVAVFFFFLIDCQLPTVQLLD
jgi:hypothetical protein